MPDTPMMPLRFAAAFATMLPPLPAACVSCYASFTIIAMLLDERYTSRRVSLLMLIALMLISLRLPLFRLMMLPRHAALRQLLLMPLSPICAAIIRCYDRRRFFFTRRRLLMLRCHDIFAADDIAAADFSPRRFSSLDYALRHWLTPICRFSFDVPPFFFRYAISPPL